MPMEANSQKNQQKHRIKLFERIVFYLPRLFSISTQKKYVPTTRNVFS